MATQKHVKRVTLTSKKNWWMVELDDDEPDLNTSPNSFSSSQTAVSAENAQVSSKSVVRQRSSAAPRSVQPTPLVYSIPRHPSSIFSFPTPTTYSAHPNPTEDLAPYAHGSASELFRAIVKKPEVVELEINGEMQSNSTDVTTQFLAELRVYTTVARHRNITAFLGCLEGVGMVLEYLEGHTLWHAIKDPPKPLDRTRKISYHNQLLAGLTHIHSYGLSHGDLSLLNVHITPDDTIKLLDFGRSVAADSFYAAPEDEPQDPFAQLQEALKRSLSQTDGRNAFSPTRYDVIKMPSGLTNGAGTLPTIPMGRDLANALSQKIEQIHPGTRPFSAPEILRGECCDPLLADAYSFGMIIVCLDREQTVDVKPWEQRKDLLPEDIFNKCELFRERAEEYLRKYDSRRRLCPEDIMK